MTTSFPPPNNAPPTEPIRLGHYELLDCIGRGGMGLVYRARDTRLDRQVAIKCLRTELFEAHYIERFKREALLLAKLNHPNIVQIYDFIEAPDQLALVMELVEGQNLQLHLREHIVPFAQRMRWLAEIAQGLAVAHDSGIIHRDLKAENILINQRKLAKITDLGIAKSQDFNGTLTDHVAGSYCSMSPEQAMGETIDFKSDLFSFGILAYQLLCGAHPFGDTNNKLQIMQRIISHPPIAPSKHNPNLPAEINDLLGQLLSKDPAKRPSNTHWVAAQLEKLSHLQLANDFVSDDTEALISNNSAANKSSVKNSGIHSAARTQDHPTFETRFIAADAAQKKSFWLPIKIYLLENKISVSFTLFSVLILAAVAIWQLQPKPPKYVAVIPPKLTADGMKESQQELVKGAVYDAIQQSVIQLDGYYLIPRSEVADVDGNTEAVRKATAADELITAEIKCKIETCEIRLSRLAPERNSNTSRLQVEDTKTLDILTDNYLTIMETIEGNIGAFYSTNLLTNSKNITEEEYANFLDVSIRYKKEGASRKLLESFNGFSRSTLSTPAVQQLFTEISLDLYYELEDITILRNLEQQLTPLSATNKSTATLYNHYYLDIAKQDFTAANRNIATLKKHNIGTSSINELEGYSALANKNFDQAIVRYQKAITAKATAQNYYYLALAYWRAGNTIQAQHNLDLSLSLSPTFYKANALYGAIALLEGNTEKSIARSAMALKQKPDDTFNINILGLSYLLDKNYAAAKQQFIRALEIAPEHTANMLNLADTETLSKNHDTASILYQRIVNALEGKKLLTEELFTLAQAYAHLGNIPDALGKLQELEQQDPQNTQTTYAASLIHTLAKNKASALYNAEQSLKNGLHSLWFQLPWFDSLCDQEPFNALMESYGAPNRCGHPSSD